MKLFLFTIAAILCVSCGDHSPTAPTCYYIVPNSLGGLTALSAKESSKLFIPACQSVKP